MSDLVAFVRARLDEDRAAAKAAPGEHWQSFGEDDIAGASVYDEQWLLLYPMRYDHDEPLSAKPGATGPQYIQRARNELAEHIARHDPARVLREVEAMRAIVDAYEAVLKECATMLRDRRPRKYGEHDGLRVAVCYLATIWRDHPDYDPDWAA